MSVAIKICGLTRPKDIEAACSNGANAIGFVFYPKSKRYVSPQQAAELVRYVPPFVQTVGLFVNALQEEVKKIVEEVPLSILQFHGNETPEYCASFHRPYIKAIRINPTIDVLFEINRYTHARGILLDADTPAFGGSGKTFDWSLIPSGHHKIILAGGLNEGNVKEAIMTVKPYAVDVSSGVEIKPGIKDAEKIRNFITRVRDIEKK